MVLLNDSMIKKLRYTKYLVMFSCVSIAVAFAKSQTSQGLAYLNLLKAAAIEIPSEFPEPGQKDLDLALAMFGIEVPSNVQHPVYDPNLADRGITVNRIDEKDYEVRIGRSAFSSWALLGSTLAHEIKVHCSQDFFLIYIADQLGFEGTAHAERAAYQYELDHADFFGLTSSDQIMIAETVSQYYPLSFNNPSSFEPMFLLAKIQDKIKALFAKKEETQEADTTTF